MEDFSFGVFDDETKTVEEFGQNIVATIKVRIGNMKRSVLTNEEAIVNKRKDRNWNVENFKPFFQNIEKRREVKR